MKLKNKKTGEIGKILKQLSEDNQLEVITDNKLYVVKTLAELNKEWEDYEEPKRHWIIDTMNDRVEDFDVPMDFNESIGNYFKTKEEAEKAVEKLKAWKRLKDKGFEFTKWEAECMSGKGTISTNFNLWEGLEEEVVEDLDLLFRSEE